MAELSESCGDYFLLPRPWLKMERPVIRPIGESCRNRPLYVRGDVLVGDRQMQLAYWHKVVWIGNVES